MRADVFEKISRGVYATRNRRFFLEFKSSTESWALRELGTRLVGYKPSPLRTATSASPLWLRSHNARAALAWARHILARDANQLS